MLPVVTDILQVHSETKFSAFIKFVSFISLTLTADKGVLHDVNRHNPSLILFDRFLTFKLQLCCVCHGRFLVSRMPQKPERF